MQQEQSAQATQQRPNGRDPKTCPGPLISREEAYAEFIRDFGRVDARIQQEVAEGEKPEPMLSPFDREHFDISEDDYKALYIIVVEAYAQLNANWNEYHSAFRALDRSSAIARQESQKKDEAMNRAFLQREADILQGVRERFRHELTEEGFQKADAYIYQWFHGGECKYTSGSRVHVKPGTTIPLLPKPQGARP